jgi:F420H(2)-dependent quinone reductase
MTTRTPSTSPQVSFATRLENVIDRHSVRLGAWLLRRTRGRVMRLWHRRALVLTTRGRRSGLPRTVVVQYFPDGPDMIVVAANSGMPTHPAWYLNLTDDPRATVEVEGRTAPVRAVPRTRDEAIAWWPRVLETAPDYTRYSERTDRALPLLRLVPVDDKVPEELSRRATSAHPRSRVPADPVGAIRRAGLVVGGDMHQNPDAAQDGRPTAPLP